MTTIERREIHLPYEMSNWKVFAAVIEGVTPLLMHSPRNLMTRDADTPKRRTIPTPEEEAEAGVYRTESGALYIGADQLRQAMITAARLFKSGRYAASRVIAPALMITSPTQFILMRNGHPLMTYDRIDIRRVVVQKNGVLRARPLIEVPWETEIRYLFDMSIVANPSLLLQALQQAGMLIGVLDFRPEKGGIFGRFSVKKAWIEET